MSTTTTTTTEISSNSNSSCRLLDCLNSLPFHDQRVFRSLLGHTDFLRLSACCRSLRSSIRNDRTLWQERYHRDFLSGAYYAKEMEFVLWCVRTDVNNPCTSNKRADLLENVDWYNTYRRRVSTENNWRYGRYNTTRIYMEHDKEGLYYRRYVSANRIFITQQDRPDRVSGHWYISKYLRHSNLRVSNNTVYSSTLPTSPNALSLNTGNEAEYHHVTGDHYIAVSPEVFENGTNYSVEVLTRKHGGVFTTFDVPVQYGVKAIEGKWILLVHESLKLFKSPPMCISGIMVFDIDNSTMCPGSIDDTWNATCFHKTTNNNAILYTARRVKDDDTDRIEWALYQFSSNNSVVQLRNGSFQVPDWLLGVTIYFAQNLYDSHMIIKIHDHAGYNSDIIHSVAFSGQSHTPRNFYTMPAQHIPIPLLRAGCDYSVFNSNLRKVWTDLSYNDDQVLRIPGTAFARHIIGDLYILIVREHNYVYNRLLVDINTKEIIRKLEAPSIGGYLNVDSTLGTIRSFNNSNMPIIQEYGEL